MLIDEPVEIVRVEIAKDLVEVDAVDEDGAIVIDAALLERGKQHSIVVDRCLGPEPADNAMQLASWSCQPMRKVRISLYSVS